MSDQKDRQEQSADGSKADLDYIKRAVAALQLELPRAVYDDFVPHLRMLIAEVERHREALPSPHRRPHFENGRCRCMCLACQDGVVGCVCRDCHCREQASS